MTNIESLKIVFLLLAVLFTIVNIGRIYYKQQIPVMNFILQAIGITGFIYMQWLMK